MTRLATDTLPWLTGETPSGSAREAIDAAIEVNRAATPKAVQDARTVKRMSVAEMNQLDWTELSERLYRQRRDDRGSVTKFLDLIDLPRNALMNTLAPRIAARKASEGDTATFGLGRVMFSDVLREMGVESQIVRGVLGFVGDVATDPLTYVGAGAVTRLSSTGGRVAQISRKGSRALRAATREAARTGAITRAPQAVKGLYEAAGVTPDLIARYRQAASASGKSGKDIERAIRSSINRRIFGEVTEGRVSRVARQLGGDRNLRRNGRAGVISRFDDMADAAGFRRAGQIQAARQFMSEFGAGGSAVKGVGRGGSQVAHIPWTDIGVNVPAFTASGRSAEAAMTIARSGKVVSTPFSSPRLARIDRLVQHSSDLDEEVSVRMADFARAEELSETEAAEVWSDINQINRRQARVRDIITRLTKRRVDGLNPDDPLDIAEVLSLGKLQKQLEYRAKQLQHGARAMAKLHEMDKIPPGLASSAEGEALLSAARSRRSAPEDLSRSASLLADAHAGYATAVRGTLMEVANTQTDRRMRTLVKQQLGVDSDSIGQSVMTPIGSMARYALGWAYDDAADAALRMSARGESAINRVFGPRGGSLVNRVKSLVADAGQGALATRELEENRLISGLREAMKRSGVSFDESFEDASELLGLMMIARRAELAENSGRAASYARTLPNSDEPTEWVKRLSQITQRHSGNKQFIGEISRLADRELARLDDMGVQSLEDGLLGSVVRDYTPLTVTRQADEAIRAANTVSNTRRGETESRRISGVLEGFQRARTTDKYRWQSPSLGREVEVYGSDLDLLADPATRQRASAEWVRGLDQGDVARLSDEFNAIQESDELREATGFRQLLSDPYELNQRAAQGAFQHLVGGSPMFTGTSASPLFEINPIASLSQRYASQQIASAKAKMKTLLRDTGIFTDDIRVSANAPLGTEIPLIGGGTARLLDRAQNGGYRVAIGDTVYKSLPSEFGRSLDSPMAKFADQADYSNMLLPERVADYLGEFDKMFRSTDGVTGVLRAAEKVTAEWKGLTLLHPSWTALNIFGDSINAIIGGATPVGLARHSRDSARILSGSLSANRIRDLEGITVAGQEIKGEALVDFIEMLRDSQVIGTNATTEVANQLARKYGFVQAPRSARSAISSIGSGATRGRIKHEASTIANIRAAAAGRSGPSTMDQVSAALEMGGNRYKKHLLEPWFAANQRVSDGIRMAMYLELRENGFDHSQAAAKVIEALFDYGDLTMVERRGLRTLLPFYTFVRNNAAYQFKRFLERPAYAAAFPKVKEAMEEVVSGDQQLPEYMRPQWIRDAMTIQLTQDPESRFGLTLGTALPQETLYNIGAATQGVGGLQSTLNYFVTSMNPIFRVILEAGTGREFFSGRTIGGDRSTSDMTLGQLLANQIRPWREVTKAAELLGDDRAEQAVLRGMLGGRVQAMDDERMERQLLRGFRESETSIRSTIRRADYRDDQELSLAARTSLMALYRQMVQVGLGEEVPKWAREQITQLSLESE